MSQLLHELEKIKSNINNLNKKLFIVQSKSYITPVIHHITHGLDYLLIDNEDKNSRVKFAQLANEADSNNGVIISDLSKNELFFGEYIKHGLLDGDVFIFSNLLESEIIQLSYLLQNKEIYPKISSSEWAYSQHIKYQIFDKEPNFSPYWMMYTINQQQTLAKYYNLMLKNFHKRK